MENKSFQSRLIYMDDYRLKKNIAKSHSLREFGDRYEYCFVKNYENIYHGYEFDSIEIGAVFVQLVTLKEKCKIVSIDFGKDLFDIEDSLMYLDFYGIKLLNEDENVITDVGHIVEAIKFKGNPIVFYEKGRDIVTIKRDELTEVTDKFIAKEQRININSSKDRDSIAPKLRIFLNDNEINYIPEIEIDPRKDLLISNGNIIVASYIGAFCKTIGFYNNKGDSLPIAWIYDKETTIYIDVYKSNNSKIINIEYEYSINFDHLL